MSGADAARFEISDDGTLSFAGLAPDFEAPADSDGDNVYEVTVRATMGDHVLRVNIAVAVADVYETPPTDISVEPFWPVGEALPAMAVADGNELTLIFTYELAAIDAATVRTLRQYFIVDGGRDAHGNVVSSQSPSGIFADSNLLMLTLAHPVVAGDQVTVSYYGGLKDIDGNEVKAFSETFTAAPSTHLGFLGR